MQSKAGKGVFWILAGAVTRPSPESLDQGTQHSGGKKKESSPPPTPTPTPTMAAGDRKKRPRAPPANPEPRKRARASDNDVANPISIDKLAWQEVSMPDRLEDVEGFMGMEEVDGVDVLRTDGGGLIYKVCYPIRTLGNAIY